ncbi:VOC family protein [bacterium]|nr:VOC family protein [bacterium]
MKYDDGKFCWADLSSTDPKASMKFYGNLLNWKFETIDGGDGHEYHIAQLGGENIAGIGPQQSPVNQSSNWNTYFYADDLNAFTQKAEKMNGTIIAPAMKAGEFGEMAIVKDPNNSMVFLWKNLAEITSDCADSIGEKPGHFCWTELITNDLEKSGGFYCDFFSWTPEPMLEMANDYFVFTSNEKYRSGMMEATGDLKKLPTGWHNYIFVEDCEKKAQQAIKLGADILLGPVDVGGFGLAMTIKDPQGGVASLFSQVKK